MPPHAPLQFSHCRPLSNSRIAIPSPVLALPSPLQFSHCHPLSNSRIAMRAARADYTPMASADVIYPPSGCHARGMRWWLCVVVRTGILASTYSDASIVFLQVQAPPTHAVPPSSLPLRGNQVPAAAHLRRRGVRARAWLLCSTLALPSALRSCLVVAPVARRRARESSSIKQRSTPRSVIAIWSRGWAHRTPSAIRTRSSCYAAPTSAKRSAAPHPAPRTPHSPPLPPPAPACSLVRPLPA